MRSLEAQFAVRASPAAPLPRGVAAICPRKNEDEIRQAMWKLGVSQFDGYNAPMSTLLRHACYQLENGELRQDWQSVSRALASAVPYVHAQREYFVVATALMALGDKNAMRSYAHFLMSVNSNYDASLLFEAIGFSPGMFRAARLHNRDYKAEWASQYSSLANYFRMKAAAKLTASFEQWRAPITRSASAIFSAAHGPMLLAYSLREQYDLCVAIAAKGLRAGYFFELFGMPLIIADTHLRRRGQERSYTEHRWLGEIEPAWIRDKRIIVVDNDIVTGRTLKRVAKELSRFDPKSLAVALTDSVMDSPCLVRNLDNVPAKYEKLHLCSHYDPMKLGEATNFALRCLGKC